MNPLIFWLSGVLVSASSFAGVPTRIEGPELTSARSVAVSIGEARRGTVIVFLSAKCPCSASHEIALKRLHQDFSKQGFQFVAIHSNIDETPEESRSHFGGTGLPFPVIQDHENHYADAFGAMKTPHAFVLSPSGEIEFQGGVDDSQVHDNAKKHYLRDALGALAEGRSPPVKMARALGCAIKR